MPTYVYTCRKGHTGEEVHPITKIPERVRCPICRCFAYRQFTPSAASVCIPMNMRASSDNTQGKQAKYLKSRKHYNQRIADEKMQDSANTYEQDYQRFTEESADLIVEHQERATAKTGPSDYKEFLSEKAVSGQGPDWIK